MPQSPCFLLYFATISFQTLYLNASQTLVTFIHLAQVFNKGTFSEKLRTQHGSFLLCAIISEYGINHSLILKISLQIHRCLNNRSSFSFFFNVIKRVPCSFYPSKAFHSTSCFLRLIYTVVWPL